MEVFISIRCNDVVWLITVGSKKGFGWIEYLGCVGELPLNVWLIRVFCGNRYQKGGTSFLCLLSRLKQGKQLQSRAKHRRGMEIVNGQKPCQNRFGFLKMIIQRNWRSFSSSLLLAWYYSYYYSTVCANHVFLNKLFLWWETTPRILVCRLCTMCKSSHCWLSLLKYLNTTDWQCWL